mgnify:CR=1 FL=1
MPDTVDAAPPVDAPKMTHAEKIKAGREKAAAARAAAAAAPVALPRPRQLQALRRSPLASGGPSR